MSSNTPICDDIYKLSKNDLSLIIKSIESSKTLKQKEIDHFQKKTLILDKEMKKIKTENKKIIQTYEENFFTTKNVFLENVEL